MSAIPPISRSVQLHDSIAVLEFARSLSSLTISHSRISSRVCSRTPRRAFGTVQRHHFRPCHRLRDGQLPSSSQDVPSVPANDQSAKLKIIETFQSFNLGSTRTMSWGRFTENIDKTGHLNGYITSIRKASKNLFFVSLINPNLRSHVQLVVDLHAIGEKATSKTTDPSSQPQDGSSPSMTTEDVEPQPTGNQDVPIRMISHRRQSSPDAPETPEWDLTNIQKLEPHTPVRVKGTIRRKKPKDGEVKSVSENGNTYRDPYVGKVEDFDSVEVHVEAIQILNIPAFQVTPKERATLGPHQRHLQFRTDSGLRKRIRARSGVMNICRQALFRQGFDEIETPLLFKSTPEGAREFIVPTRQAGMAYALPQSPQQFKQMLMASGVRRYFQFARCFRDEDMRADRQPEFTQLDMELSFTSSRTVRGVIEELVLKNILPVARPDLMKALNKTAGRQNGSLTDGVTSFPMMKYQSAMTLYGTDKPDTRLRGQIRRVDRFIPSTLKDMLTSLKNPITELVHIRVLGEDAERSQKFVASFMDSPAGRTYTENPHGTPGVTVFDRQKPVNGLAAFGFEAASRVEEMCKPKTGDIFIIQTRPAEPLSGSSTPLGNLRRDLMYLATKEGLREPLAPFAPVWIHDFPLFTRVRSTDGSSTTSEICSTHHPFTAPVEWEDPSKLLVDPLSVTGDHFDLVINGIEIGGGSRRIHYAPMQEFIFRDVLKLPPEQIQNFSHLLDALKDGCPPHAGFAFGFDRLMALLMDASSVRDVIAFPKYGNGVDHQFKAPSSLTPEQLSTYHLAISESGDVEESKTVSIKA